MNNRAASVDELSQMQRLLEQSLEARPFGYSTGLERNCSEDEVTALCHLCAAAGGLYAIHTCNLPAKLIHAAEAASVAFQISHSSMVARLADDAGWAGAHALAITRRDDRLAARLVDLLERDLAS